MAFCVPYIALFLVFVAYPVGFGIWLGSDPALYAELFSDPIYLQTLANTALFLGIAINLKLFLAVLLSGFFFLGGRRTKALLIVFLLPWVMSGQVSYMSIHWMLDGDWGLISNILWHVFGVEDGPHLLVHRWSALAAVMGSHIWKWLPFWTVILLAGRAAIPVEVREAAKLDGASGWRMFVHVNFPLLANLYLTCTLLATIFAFGEYNAIIFVSGGGPVHGTHMLATLGIRYAIDMAQPRLGMAAVFSALPLLALVIVLMRKFKSSQIGAVRRRCRSTPTRKPCSTWRGWRTGRPSTPCRRPRRANFIGPGARCCRPTLCRCEIARGARSERYRGRVGRSRCGSIAARRATGCRVWCSFTAAAGWSAISRRTTRCAGIWR